MRHIKLIAKELPARAGGGDKITITPGFISVLEWKYGEFYAGVWQDAFEAKGKYQP